MPGIPPGITLTCKPIPCKSIYKIANLLVPPKKYSLISSKLWNEIVQDLYLTYNIFKYINYLSKFPYPNYIYPAIMEFYNFYENFQPYPFIPLLHAEKGMALTVEEFNKLIDAILELANETNIQLQANLNKVHNDEVVKSSRFRDIVYDVNQFLTFNYNQYFLLDCDGSKFANLLNSISTFLNVLIAILPGQTSSSGTGIIQLDLSIPSNAYIKNLLIYCNSQIINIYGLIVNLVLNSNLGYVLLRNFASINFLILNKNFQIIGFLENSNGNIVQVNQNFGTIEAINNSSVNIIQTNQNSNVIGIGNNANVITIQTNKNFGVIVFFENSYGNVIQIDQNPGFIIILNNANINTMQINQNSGNIIIEDNASVTTLQVNQNSGKIEINGNAYVENLICEENTGTISIASTATVSNISCPSS